jgi:8-oxo-dGTP pyrophosphatase MutT (NUDIX family)
MPTPSVVQCQAGAIPLRAGQVCLVSSRSGKRWVVPKGCLEPGKSAGQIALQESWEEAGLAGILRPDPIGTFLYEKAGLICHVVVFQLDVTQAADDWPERAIRERCWLPLLQAAGRVEDVGLREILRGLAAAREAS